jgi:hypothetical protein
MGVIERVLLGLDAALGGRKRPPVEAALLWRSKLALDPLVGCFYGIVGIALVADEDRPDRRCLPVHWSTALGAFIGRKKARHRRVQISANVNQCRS